jgi:hypothetical protein
MKSFPLTLVAISISIICILCCGLVFALNPDEASVSLIWSSQPVYNGDIAFIRINFESNSADQLKIYRLGLHFDWMPPNEFYTSDFSANPVFIPSYGTHIFDVITIQIPLNVTTGSHSYFVGVEGTQGFSPSAFSWDSPESTIQIHATIEKIYNTFLSQVKSKLNEAISANYESAEAQSLLQQAQTEYDSATSLASESKWGEAISSLENASDYVEQAEAAEQLSAEQSAQQQPLLLYIAIIVIVVVVAAVIAVIWRKKRKMKPKAKQPPLKEELTISSVAFSGGNTIDVVVDNSGTKDLVIAEVWINNEKQTFTTTPAIEKIPPNESVHVSVTYAYSKGTNYHIKIVSDRKNFHLVSTTAV